MAPPDRDVPLEQTRPIDRRMTIEPRPGDAPVATILGRRDVALVPWLSITAGSFAVAISTWLRGDGAPHDDLVFWCAIGGGVGSAVLAAIQDSWIGRRYRGSLWVYLLVSLLLLGWLTVAGYRDAGLSTVYFIASVLLASYLGLVFPSRWGRYGIAVILLVAGGLQIANPAGSWFDATVVAGLTFAGWLIGSLGALAHGRAARVANAISSYDRLTAMLNRRGMLRQIDRYLGLRDEPDAPLALLIVDLDGLKAINDQRGHAAGDELLAWVGRTIPQSLPETAELGRLGGDEFAVLLPHTSHAEAVAIGQAIRTGLAERIGASVGIATSQSRLVAAGDLFRVADAALSICKRDRSLGVHALVAGTVRSATPSRRKSKTDHVRPLSYAQLRATGKPPRVPEPGIVYGWMVSRGLAVIAAAGAYVVAGALMGEGSGFYNEVLRYVGIPWVLWMLALALSTRGRGVIVEGVRFEVVFYGCSIALGLGLAVAMLANGGLTAPIVGGLFMKTLFDASIMPPNRARQTLAVMVLSWLLAAILGPASALWVAPFHLTIFGAAFALGSIGYRAFDDVTRHTMAQAHTDALTHVRNRLGFEEMAEAALVAAKTEGAPFGLLVLDLDDFKAVNDASGHAAGDELLRKVADTLGATFPDAQIIGRLGGDEFVLVVPVEAEDDARAQARQLATALRSTAGASVGHAVFPQDGDDLGTLLIAADQRSYEQKRDRPRGPDARLRAA